MKKLRMFIVLLAIIIVTLVFCITRIKKKETYLVTPDITAKSIEEGGTYDASKEKEVASVTNQLMFYTVVNCINQYLQNCSAIISTDSTIDLQEEVIKTRVYSELSKEYIEENNITVENVKEYVHTMENYLVFYPIEMNFLKSELNNMISNYGVYGRLRNYNTGQIIGYTYIIVTIDLNNMTFAIEPYIKSNINSLNELDLATTIDNIEKTDNNQFTYEYVDDEILIKKYISMYKLYALNHPEIAYEYVDEDYRTARFGNLEGFEQYVNENRQKIQNIYLDKYQKTIKDDYTQYVCIDRNGNYYIFRETAVMQYKLLLDTYTIDIPEFTEKYNKADNETKVGMNIEKILTALNNKDYNYIYSKLASSFKNNYFPTVDSLKQYMETNLFEKNTIEYDTVDNEGGNYMFDIQFNNASDETSSPVAKRIIMQLKEGTDFVFSFNVD